jgi:putative ABC transport system substrate-binding protein
VRSKVDLIVAVGTQAARTALSETSTIPIVFMSGDPVAAGLAASLAHPGANATGLSSQTTDLMAKRLQLLQEIAPRTRRVMVLVNPDGPLHTGVLSETQKAGRSLRIDVTALNARDVKELDAVLSGIQHRSGDALIVSSDVFFIANRDQIAKAVRKAKLPTLVPNRDYWGEGVLMAYGSSLKELDHRAAVYIDKIIKGAKPGDLPIEQGSVRLLIDLRVARELGLTVSQDLLYLADEVIR